MSMGHTRETPTPPRPVFETLPKAVAAAIAHGNTLPDLNLPRWAITYGCSVEDVKNAWEKALWIATQQPVGFEDMGEGK